MDDSKPDFLIQAAILDRYVHLDNPGDDMVAVGVILEALKASPDLYRYFFAQKPTAGWAQHLYQYGVFTEPPGVIRDGDSYRTPFWAPAAYLADVAEENAALTTKLVSEIETDNPIIHEYLTKALSVLPAEAVLPCLEKVKKWLQGEYRGWWGLAQNAALLAQGLAERGYILESIHIIDELLEPVPSEQRNVGGTAFRMPATTHFELHFLAPDFWKQILPAICVCSPSRYVRVLEARLVESMELELSDPDVRVGLESPASSWWRSSIGDSNQDSPTDLKHLLLAALRDTLDNWATKNAEEARLVVTDYLSGNKIILRRVALHVAARHLHDFGDVCRSELLDPAFHDDISFHNEYFFLLRKAFSSLSEADQQKVIQIILEGPNPAKLEDSAARAGGDDEAAREKYAVLRRATWTRDRLAVIKQYLDSETEAALADLVDRFGKPDHPEFLAWASEVYSIRDVSPVARDDLAAMSVSQLGNYLTEWAPPPDVGWGPERVSLEGLSQEVAGILLDSSDKYEELIAKLPALNPLYSATLFTQAQRRLKEGLSVSWAHLLPVMLECSVQKRATRPPEDPNNFEARISAIRLLEDGLSASASIPLELRSLAKSVILAYIDDPSPDASEDHPPEGYFGHNDPITVAVNCIRPIALTCYLALLKIGAEPMQPEVEQTHSLDHDARTILETRLDTSKESSWAVHSIYGKYLWFLAKADSEWLVAHKKDIFPMEETEDSQARFDAAWDSYIIFNHPNTPTFEMLDAEYRFAIRRLATARTTTPMLDVARRFSSHILLHYIHSSYPLGDEGSLLGEFYGHADAPMRASAAHTLSAIVSSMAQADAPALWPRVRDLWQWRLAAVAASDYPEDHARELDQLAGLLPMVPETVPIPVLWPALEVFLRFKASYLVWKHLQDFLAARVETESLQVATFYRLMHEDVEERPSGFQPHDKSADQILESLMANPNTRVDARAVIDRIARRDPDRYRNLYDRYA